MTIDKITTDNDLINFLLDRHKETGNHMFLVAANSIALYQRDINYLNFCWSEQTNWISVKDRLPETNQEVLVYRGSHIGDLMNVYTYVGNDKWEDEYGYWSVTDDEGITHWMPLPAPPTEEEN